MLGGSLSPAVMAAISQSPTVKRAVRGVANLIRGEARRLAPKVSGNLKANIAVESFYDARTSRVEYHVGWNKRAFYGSLVELGTEDTPARPHLRPAADMFNRDTSGPDPSELIDYVTKSGKVRKATRAQVANWTRGSRSKASASTASA